MNRAVTLVSMVVLSTIGMTPSRALPQDAVTSASNNSSARVGPELVPQLRHPMNGELLVKNVGTAPAGPSRLTLDCQEVKGGIPSDAGDCPDLPPEIAPTYYDPKFPKNLTIKVPNLAPGATFRHTLSFWSTFHWPSGTYKFTAVADAAYEVNERDRKNNTATSTLTVR